jgi:hypothetical protein
VINIDKTVDPVKCSVRTDILTFATFTAADRYDKTFTFSHLNCLMCESYISFDIHCKNTLKYLQVIECPDE